MIRKTKNMRLVYTLSDLIQWKSVEKKTYITILPSQIHNKSRPLQDYNNNCIFSCKPHRKLSLYILRAVTGPKHLTYNAIVTTKYISYLSQFTTPAPQNAPSTALLFS